jgi:serine/threonine-protein kinase RsbW
MTKQTFPARFESLAKIAAVVERAARQAGLDDRATYAMQLAVDEACTNIIEHAYGGEGKGSIECRCEVIEDGLKVTLLDWGKPFDPTEIEEPDFSLPLEDLRMGGAGLILMQRTMDEVQFDTAARERNKLVLIKRRTQG